MSLFSVIIKCFKGYICLEGDKFIIGGEGEGLDLVRSCEVYKGEFMVF